MQSGSIHQRAVQTGSAPQNRPPREAPAERAEADQAAPEAFQEPEELVTLAARFRVGQEALKAETQEDGNQRSEMTIALVPQRDREALESRGVVFPELEEVRSNAGLDAEGRIDLVPVPGTGNPETTHIVETLEVPKAHLEVDPKTGTAPIEDYTIALIPNGAGILPEGHFAVPDGTEVAPKGYEFDLGTSKAGLETEKKRLRLNTLADTVGTFSQSSLVGLFNIPYFTPIAPVLALGTAGATLNHHAQNLKKAQDTLGYVEGREKLASSDMVTLELGVGYEIPVSAEAEKSRLSTQVRQAKGKLASSALLGAAGASSIVGLMAQAGALGAGGGAAALTAAGAAAPYLAGAAMMAGSASMVFDSVDKLKSLSKEKTRLEGLVDQGQTHVLRTVERMDPQLKRPVAINEAEVPIDERLKQIGKEQRKHRLLATAMSGGMGMMAGTVALGTGAFALAPIALGPAAVVGSAQSIGRLKELSGEKKGLLELQSQGEKMVPRQLEQTDGSWRGEKVPISNLLSDIKKEQNKHKLILTAVGSTAAAVGMTLGAGMSIAAAAPVVLVPAIVGAALFPDKVKEFTAKVFDFLKGKFGEDGSSRKEALGHAKEAAEVAKTKNAEITDSLRESAPHLFARDGNGLRRMTGKSEDGYMVVLDKTIDQYAKASTSAGRAEALESLDKLIAAAPPEAREHMAAITANLQAMKMETEAAWTARDIAMELKAPRTEKMLADDRLKDRIAELGFPTDGLKDQYRESLELENDEARLGEVVERAQAGDLESNRAIARTQVFSAARNLYQSKEELGNGLYARLIEALGTPDDTENLELVTKEIAYRLQAPVQQEQLSGVAQALSLLETPIEGLGADAEPSAQVRAHQSFAQLEAADPENAAKLRELEAQLADPATFEGLGAQEALAQRTKLNASYFAAKRAFSGENVGAVKEWEASVREARSEGSPTPVEPQPTVLVGPEQRMAQAYRELRGADPESADRLGQAFARLNDPSYYEGQTIEQAQQTKLAAATELTRARAELAKSAPEALEVWDRARVEVEEEYFQRSIDHDFKDAVLQRPEVAEAVGRLELDSELAEELFVGLLRSQVLGDGSRLQVALADSAGEQVEPAKAELLETIDQAMLAVVAGSNPEAQGASVPQESPGATAAEPRALPAREDPKIQQHLQDNPIIEAAFATPEFGQLAGQLQVGAEELESQYLELLRIGTDPLAAAEFHGRLEGGDVSARRMLEMGQAVDEMILAMARPDEDMLQAQVVEAMAGVAVQSVLSFDEIQAMGQELGVDSEAAMRRLLSAELSADASALEELHAKAVSGDQSARAEYEMTQVLAQTLMQVNAQLAQQAGGSPPPRAA